VGALARLMRIGSQTTTARIGTRDLEGGPLRPRFDKAPRHKATKNGMSAAVERAILSALLGALSCSKAEVPPQRSGSTQGTARRTGPTDPTAEDYQMPQLPRAR